MTMFLYILFTVLLLTPVLWLWSVLSLWRWHYFIPFFLLNAAILGAYLFATLGRAINFFGHDEYGLNWVAAFVALATHIILVSLFTLKLRSNQSKMVKSKNLVS